jgi:hypothetical protein
MLLLSIRSSLIHSNHLVEFFWFCVFCCFHTFGPMRYPGLYVLAFRKVCDMVTDIIIRALNVTFNRPLAYAPIDGAWRAMFVIERPFIFFYSVTTSLFGYGASLFFVLAKRFDIRFACNRSLCIHFSSCFPPVFDEPSLPSINDRNYTFSFY